MEYRTISDSDLKVSKICLGTMTWGQQNTEEEAHEQLDYAIGEAGINFIDTAEIYPIPPEKEKQGRTESYIGSWLKKRGKRDDLIIASKVAGPQQNGSIGTRSGSGHFDRENIREAIEGSLQRLNTDYLDVYQLHRPERDMHCFGVRGYVEDQGSGEVSIEETLEVLNELVKEGKVRYIGLSNESAWGVSEFLRIAREKGYPKIITTQNQYSLINRTYEIGLSEFAPREGVELLAYSSLSMGVLTGKYLDGARPEGARFTLFDRSRERYNPPHAQEAVRKYVELAREHNLDPAQMAIAFVNNRPFVAANIIGATTMDQLKTNIAAGDIALSEEVRAGIEEIYTTHPDPTC